MLSAKRALLGIGGLIYLLWYCFEFALQTTEYFPLGKVLNWGFGDCALIALASLITILLVHCDFESRNAWKLIMMMVGGSALIEFLNLFYGLPFGNLMYTDGLGLRLFKQLPWIIPFLWFVLLANVYVICSVIVFNRTSSVVPETKFMVIVLSSLMVALMGANWEPVALNVKEYWISLERDQWYYGISRLKFIGWFTTSVLLIGISTTYVDPRRFRIQTAWKSLLLLASIQFLFCVINWQAEQFLPVILGLNVIGGLSVGLIYISGK
jgi:uncharacterized membrane protein